MYRRSATMHPFRHTRSLLCPLLPLVVAALLPFGGATAATPAAPAPASGASAPESELQSVTVQGESTVTRESKPVSDLLDALDVFKKERATYAPNGEFHIRVLPRKDLQDADEIHLELRYGQTREPIELDALGRFSVPESWRQLPSDAIVRSKLEKGRLAWMVDVRTPGMAVNERRVGDLQLECRSDLHGGGLMRGVKLPAFFAIRAVGDLCSISAVIIGFVADGPVFTAKVRHGGHEQELPYRFLHLSEMGQDNVLFGLIDLAYALRDRTVNFPANTWNKWSPDATLVLNPMEEKRP